MANWNTIDELRQIFIDKYITSKLSTELEKACSEEYELMRDYNGRQILELLQNVDDACSENQKGESEVYIKFVDNILEVGNTGTTFNRDTIERLCLGRASSKSASNIGNKGTGFRSLLNDAEWIEIHSGNFSIKFSYDYTKKLFSKYVNESDENYSELIATQKRNWKKDYDLCFPILNCPEEIEKVDSKFDTLIRIKVKDTNASKTNSIESQLNLPFYKSILFLPHITKIIIETKNLVREYEKGIDFKEGYDDVLIQDNKKNIEHYYLFKKQVKIKEEKVADLIIAYLVGVQAFDFSKEKLYCYFPIRNFQTPIHALIHAPFLTNSSRDDVPNDSEQINYAIFNEIAIFIKEVAEKLKDLENTNAIEFVTPINFYDNKMWDKEIFDLGDKYIDLLCDSKIIPTVNNKYISINDNPKILKVNFPDEFKGEGFENLVKKIVNEDVYNFIEDMCKRKNLNHNFCDKELCEAINCHSNEYDNDLATKVFLWWSENYYYRKSPFLPKLLKDTTDNWIQKDNKVFLPTNDGISMLGNSLQWVNLCVLKQEYVTSLIETIKKDNTIRWEFIKDRYSSDTNEKRLLDAYSDSYLAVKFTEQSSSRVVISEIVNQVDDTSKAISFINWFFENYKDKITADSELAKLKFKLPDRTGTLQETKYLYFGKEYDKALADKIFGDNYFAVCPLEDMYTAKETEGFKEFIAICGVLSYPKQKKINLQEINDWHFIEHVKSRYNISFNVNYMETFSIENFTQLLLKLTTKEIVELLTKDYSLSSLILSTERQSLVKERSNWSPTYFNSNEYVLYVLNNTKWIEIEGKKYSPKDIIKYGKLKGRLDSLYGIQEKELIALLDDDIVKRYNLAFKENFSDFSSNQILEILQKLPDIDNGEISRRLYTDIIKFNRDKKPEYNPSDIKLIAKDGKFYSNKDLVYVDKSIPQIIENNKKVDIPIQQNTETIKNWFGVNKVELKLQLKEFIPITNFNVFDEELKDLKVCILSMLDDTTNFINRLQRMKVVPCSEIIAIDTIANCQIEMNNYSFIKKDGEFYFKLPSIDIVSIRSCHEYALALIEMFKETVSPQISMDLAELLISKNPKEKKLKIEEKYGIDKWNNSYELLFEKSYLSKIVEKFFVDNNLSVELLNKVSGIDFSSNLLDEDFALLFECLENIGKDICDINNINETINIDAKMYIKKQCVNMLCSFRSVYRICCYLFLKDKPEDQSQYLSMINVFDNYDFSDIEIQNSIYFDCRKILKEKFPLFNENVKETIDVDDIYNNNYCKCVEVEGVFKTDFDYFIDENIKHRSMLYFEHDGVVKEFFSLKAKEESLGLDVNKSEKEEDKETSIINTELIPVEQTSKSQKQVHYSGEYGEKKTKEKNDNNEKAGKDAEGIAYEKLKKTYPELIWNSKYTIIPADKNRQPPNNITCDMWNYSKDGNTYFEVKSSTTEFEMSINEYESMKNNKTNYYVVLVDRKTKEVSLHLFDELDALKKPSKYKFAFKQKRLC